MDLRFAQLMALMGNQLHRLTAAVVRDEPQINRYPYTTADFMPDFLSAAPPEKGQTADQQYALLEQVTHMTGGKMFSADATDEELEAYVLGGPSLRVADDEALFRDEE